MSIRVMTRIWDKAEVEGSELLVLLALADRSDDYGCCWPGIQNLAKKSRLTERGVQKVIRKLEATGDLYIITNHGRGSTNMYFVITGLSLAEIISVFIDRLKIGSQEATLLAQSIIDKRVSTSSSVTAEKMNPSSPINSVEKVNVEALKGERQSEKVNKTSIKGELASSPDSSINTSLDSSIKQEVKSKIFPPWKSIKYQLQQSSQPTYFRLIEDLDMTVENGRYFVDVFSDGQKHLLDGRFKQSIDRLLPALSGDPGATVEFRVTKIPEYVDI